jgi:hypothetical protein
MSKVCVQIFFNLFNEIFKTLIKIILIDYSILPFNVFILQSDFSFNSLVRNSKSFEPYSINLYLDIFH